MVDIISTTKDNPDNANTAPNTASDIEEEDTEVEHEYIIKDAQLTITNLAMRW